jgi:CheY-like chemotaxis protein
MKPMCCDSERLKVVLVVEDCEEDFSLLEHASRQVPSAPSFHSVPSGEEAVRYLEGEGPFGDRKAHPIPDLVLLDLGLPGVDGLELLAWIRKRPELQDLKVFIWTDAGQPDILERATQAGANRFVPKSVAFVRGGLAGLINGMAEAIAESPDRGVNEPSQPRNPANSSSCGDARHSGRPKTASRLESVGGLPAA